MIISITPNPSIDISYFIDHFQQGQVHRVYNMAKVPGGKGLNVAKVLHILGAQTKCTGFIGGSGGEYIVQGLSELGISSEFIPIQGETRSCLAINDLKNGKTTEIRENGPTVQKQDIDHLIQYLTASKPNIDLFSCSGSLPAGLDHTFFDVLLEHLKDKITVLDVSGDNLRHVVLKCKEKPTAIKPNIDELRDLFEEEVDTMSYLSLLQHPVFIDIPIVILSLGKEGCIAKMYRQFYECHVPDIQAVNPVGSGDASLAGLCYGLEKRLPNEEILKLSMSCGVLNAMEEKIGHIDINQLEQMKDQIHVREIG